MNKEESGFNYKEKEDEESKKAKKIWPKNEILNLIALRGEIEFEFANTPPPRLNVSYQHLVVFFEVYFSFET
jgi:hypothetical protein